MKLTNVTTWTARPDLIGYPSGVPIVADTAEPYEGGGFKNRLIALATGDGAAEHARLIAAAPAMHEALRRIAAFVLDGEPCDCAEDDPDSDHSGEHAMTIDAAFEDLAAAVHLARAALGEELTR